ncbi:MAG: DUF3368 domain-containing protein [Candidatus Sumerlaeota bacterium]|nr:DUF3368 domain-containing protein [Candidatus Sumerlaeota bacterium]
MRRVVSNSSPLIYLAKIGRINLLEKQFGQITIPPAVWREVVEEGQEREDARIIADAKWIKVHPISPSPLLTNLKSFLDDGESEAIALAVEIRAATILLDEYEARKTAQFNGLNMIGLIGVLLAAKTSGDICSLQGCLDQLEQAGFRISAHLRQQALALASE